MNNQLNKTIAAACVFVCSLTLSQMTFANNASSKEPIIRLLMEHLQGEDVRKKIEVTLQGYESFVLDDRVEVLPKTRCTSKNTATIDGKGVSIGTFVKVSGGVSQDSLRINLSYYFSEQLAFNTVTTAGCYVDLPSVKEWSGTGNRLLKANEKTLISSQISANMPTSSMRVTWLR
jgi:hypothetical protein